MSAVVQGIGEAVRQGAVGRAYERCERHGLATSPDGRCAICRRERVAYERALTRQADRTRRRVAAGVVAVVALFAAFSLLMATFDTAEKESRATPPVTQGEKAVNN